MDTECTYRHFAKVPLEQARGNSSVVHVAIAPKGCGRRVVARQGRQRHGTLARDPVTRLHKGEAIGDKHTRTHAQMLGNY